MRRDERKKGNGVSIGGAGDDTKEKRKSKMSEKDEQRRRASWRFNVPVDERERAR